MGYSGPYALWLVAESTHLVLPRHTPPCGQRIEQRERSALKINRLNQADIPVEHFLGGWWSIKIYHIPSELYSKKNKEYGCGKRSHTPCCASYV